MSIDITEQKRSEQEREQALRALQEAGARKAAILETALDCIISIDAQDRIIEFNPAAEATFGYRRDEVLGHNLAERIIPPAHREAHYAGLTRYLVTGEGPVLGRRIEVMAMRKDGTEFPVELAIAALDPAQGQPPLFTAYLRDITEQKRTEAELNAAYERERRIAASFQHSLLRTPAEDAFPGLVVKTLYTPAWDEAQVGGDFFDAFALGEGKIAFVVGDVSGKGLAAAAHTAEVKAVLRAFLREHPHPGRALERVNAFLLDAERLDHEDGAEPGGSSSAAAAAPLIGLSVAVVDTAPAAEGEVVFAVAGMEPPLIVRASGEAQEIPVGGPPLGAVPRIEYPAVAAAPGPLAAGDLVVMTTDGVTEARRGRADFLGYEGLIRLAQGGARSHSSMGDIGQAILQGALAHAGGKLQDDACLLLVRRTARSDSAGHCEDKPIGNTSSVASRR